MMANKRVWVWKQGRGNERGKEKRKKERKERKKRGRHEKGEVG